MIPVRTCIENMYAIRSITYRIMWGGSDSNVSADSRVELGWVGTLQTVRYMPVLNAMACISHGKRNIRNAMSYLTLLINLIKPIIL